MRDHLTEQKVKWQKMSETKTFNCTDCETETATGLCTTCQLKLCNFCTSYHQRSARFKDHVVQSVEVVPNEELFDKQPIRCTAHNKKIKYYCENCQLSICGECVLTKSHKGHIFESIDSVMAREVTALRESIESSENATTQYMEHLENAKRFQAKANTERVTSKKLIDDAFGELFKLIEFERDLMSERRIG